MKVLFIACFSTFNLLSLKQYRPQWSYFQKRDLEIVYIYTVGKISIEHATKFVSKYISKGSTDMKF